MPTQSATKINYTEAEEGFEPLQDKTQKLPPLLILEVGSSARFILNDVNEVVDDGEQRTYYRGVLKLDTVGLTKEKGETEYHKQQFKAGDQISLPGSGGLDFNMAKIAKLKARTPSVKEAPWGVLFGDLFVVSRQPDEIMSKGKHKGKPVKVYTVQHAAKKA